MFLSVANFSFFLLLVGTNFCTDLRGLLINLSVLGMGMHALRKILKERE